MNNHHYTVSDKVGLVLANDYRLLQVMSRFGITLGFGDKNINEVCQQCKTDPYTFISIINFVKDGGTNPPDNIERININDLLQYLRRTHKYFLDFLFPRLRRNMLNAIDCSVKNEVAFLVLKFYDDYVEEVRKHMELEENTTFVYVENVICAENTLKSKKQKTDFLAHHHNEIENKLSELKNLFIQYYPQKEIDNEINEVVYQLYRAQEDLLMHCRIEENIFLPVIHHYELLAAQKKQARIMAEQDKQMEMENTLSERERDVVICVAKGLSNKEIADKLFLSVNTVTTHRRNIAKKLAIHTPAGITIYAIVNKLVKLEEVNI